MLSDTPTSGKPQGRPIAPARRFRRLSARLEVALDTRCPVCGARTHTRLCNACFRDLPWNDHACRQCARALPDLPASLCGACSRQPPSYDSAHAAFTYAWPVDRLIRRFKFNADLATGRILALLLGTYLDLHQIRRPDLLLPVPLHHRRLAERGFNQSSEVARILRRRLDTKMAFDRLLRIRATPAQSGLDRATRQRNLRRAFECRGSLSGLHIGIVDDVMTTGSTAQAAAVALKRAGAVRVDVYALARA